MEEENLEKDMTPILLEDLGMRYPNENSKERKRYGLYQCQYCGKEWEASTQAVKQGNTKSCGCQSIKYRNPHGLYKHPLYQCWRDMKARCNNLKSKNYKNYGARGIKVCERWLDINNFIEDMYPTWEEGLSLDRIDVNEDYDPNNCRWVTQNIQSRNTKDIRITNTSGFRGASFNTKEGKWKSQICVCGDVIGLGTYTTALEAAKAYERYVRLNNLEHNFTPALTEEEIEEINKQKGK